MDSDTQDEISQKSVQELIIAAHQACARLNSCLPQAERIDFQCSLTMLAQGMESLAKRIVDSIQLYQRNLQHLQQTLRKHIKNQIELKLYYEHLEEVISNLKKEKEKDQECIESLKTELKDKQRYLMTVTNHNTKSGEEVMGGLESKLDTITKIKNRLSLNDTGDFYGRTFAKRNERQHDTKDLHHKRQNLASALQKLCEKPEQKSASKKKQKQIRSKSRSKKQLQTSKSGRSLHSHFQMAQSPAQKPAKPKGPSKQKDKHKNSINYIKSGLSSRRNSKC